MKHLRIYEDYSNIKKYFIVQNFKDFRYKDIDLILFYYFYPIKTASFDIDKSIPDNRIIAKQLMYCSYGRIVDQRKNNLTDSVLHMDEVSNHVVYETGDLEDAIKMLEILAVSERYNL